MTGTPVIGDGYVKSSTGTIRTYGSTGSPTAFNTWLDGLGDNEGISSFNLWLQDGYTNQAAMWGETLAFTDPYSNAITASASEGWTASIYTMTLEDGWGAGWVGRKMIMYTANSAEYYLKPGNNVQFGFTADLMGNDGATGPDYQIWVGSDGIAGHSGENYFQRAVGASSVPGPAALLPFLGGLLLAVRRQRRK
jgi:hypothetical protein